MTASLFEKIAWTVALLVLLPVLINPASWIVAILLAIAVLVSFYVGRYLLDLEKQRRMGERGMIKDVRYGREGDK
jgi:hypothetical protein